MEKALLPASTFNSIKLLEDQTIPIPPLLLQDLANLFVDAKLHTQWGVGLLHRHQTIPEHHVMLHERRVDGVDICKPQASHGIGRDLNPHALLLNAKHKLQAYEFDLESDRLSFPDDFVEHFRDLLVAHHMEDSIAVVANPATENGQGETQVENLIVDDDGRVVGSMSMPRQQHTDGRTTNWKFVGDDGQVAVVDVKRCVETETKLHMVVKDAEVEWIRCPVIPTPS